MILKYLARFCKEVNDQNLKAFYGYSCNLLYIQSMTCFRTTIYILGVLSILIPIGCQPDSQSAEAPLPEVVDFNFHIKPILSDRCFACHGPDDKARKAELRLDMEDQAFAALKESEGFAIVAGKADESALVHRIFSEDPEVLMPPPESEMHLTETEKALLVQWIEQGAEWKKHWAFIPPEKPELPEIRNAQWTKNEIDYFVAQKLMEKGLKPSPPASKTQWLRRVTFDITGLPPTPGAVQAFLADDSDEAFERVVDRLLTSSAYGERMASLWLDVARYADSHGYQDDRPRTMWPWRDWVIRAFNENLPYDKFVTWQLAGDLLPNATYEQKLATGFNRNHAITQEGGVVQEEYLAEYAADRVNTFSTAFLGVTMECARCHTHKYDPFSQEEYYSLVSFFNNIPERGQISYFDEAPSPSIPLQDPLRDSAIAAVKQWIDQKEEALETFKLQPQKGFEGWYKNPPSPKQIQADLQKKLITHFTLDQQEGEYFHSEVSHRPEGRMNINLPAEIPVPRTVPGKKGNALVFDGKNFLSLGEIGDVEWYNEISFGGWIRHEGMHEKDAGIFSRRVGEQKRHGYDLVLTPKNTLSARLINQYNPNRESGNYAIAVETFSKVPEASWQHVMVTYNGSGKASGLSIYINGEAAQLKILVDSLRGKTIANGNDFLVGNWNHRARELGDLYGFKGGAVDEVYVFDRELSSLEVHALSGSSKKADRSTWLSHYQKSNHIFRELKVALDSLRRIDQTVPQIMVMEEADTVEATFLLDRGAYDAPAQRVSRATPQAILPFGEKYPRNRLGLAQWLMDEQNPLASRVIVNRFWQIFFGRGLVATPEDFGNQGDFPTHPELLDWLAVDFRGNGWDMKKLVRTIVLSATYRQDAAFTPSSTKKDPDNTWLSRGPAQRLQAEMLRDQALLASGLYYEKVGGQWVKPYQTVGIWKELANQIGENKYRPSLGRDLYRRSLYSYWKRTIPPPAMLTFDASERAVCTVKRQETSTPLQALILLNAPIYVEASRSLAERALQDQKDAKQAIAWAFSRIVSRPPEPEEEKLLEGLLAEEHQRFEAEPAEASSLLAIGNSGYDTSIPVPELAAMTVVVNAMFNLDEAKYR